MKSKILLCLALILGGCLVGCRTANPSGPYRISGKVQDAQSRPVADVPLEIYSYDIRAWRPMELKFERQARTDAGGMFHFSSTNDYTTVLIHQPGSAAVWRRFKSSADQFTQTPLTLTAPLAVSGTVVDETGLPVADAEVWAFEAESTTPLSEERFSYDVLSGPPARQSFSTHSSADGRFRIDGFPSNTVVNLTAAKPGKALGEPLLEPGHIDDMQFRAGQDNCKLVLEPSGAIEGKIVAQETSQPLAGVKIWLKRVQATYSTDGGRMPVESGPDGTFRFTDLSAGRYWVDANFGPVPARVAKSVSTSVEAGKTTRDVMVMAHDAMVMASKGGLVRAIVIDAKSRKPLTGADISANGTAGTTDGRGIALVRLLPGKYDVYARKSNWSLGKSTAQVELGRTNEIRFELTPPVRIKGILRDPSGTPAPGVRVSVFPYGSGESTHTDARGRFEITWNPRPMGALDSVWLNCLVARDWRRNLALVQNIEDTYKTVDLRLQPAITVSGAVKDEQAKPIANAWIHIGMTLSRNNHSGGYSSSSGDLGEDRAYTDAQGRFELAVLPQGQDLSITASAQGYNWTNASPDMNLTATNRIELPPMVLKHIEKSGK